jgi:hypothetical protein
MQRNQNTLKNSSKEFCNFKIQLQLDYISPKSETSKKKKLAILNDQLCQKATFKLIIKQIDFTRLLFIVKAGGFQRKLLLLTQRNK